MSHAITQDTYEETINYKHPVIQQNNSSKNSTPCSYYFEDLLNSMDQGYCIIDMVFDSNNKPCDYLFVDVNPAFEKQTGLKDVKGKLIKDLKPDHEQFWFDMYGQIALTGEPLRFQGWASQLRRYYDVYAFRVNESSEKKVAVLFNDVTDKKRAESNLSFLFDISKILIDSVGSGEIMESAGAKMGEYLNLSYFVFAKILREEKKIEIIYNWRPAHLPDINGVYSVSDYITDDMKPVKHQGDSIVVNNTLTDPRLRPEKYQGSPVGSFITLPLKRNNEWEFLVCVCRGEANTWRPDEIKVVREATLNVWTSLERRRAEQDLFYSEERLRLAIETGKVGICDMDYSSGTAYCNDVRYAMYGMKPGNSRTPVSEFLLRTHPDDIEALKQSAMLGIETTGKYRAEFRVVHPDGTVRWISENGQVTEWQQGKPQRVISTLIDITERKTEEQQKDDFFKIASHELKSPVTNIKSVAYMLEHSLPPDSDPLLLELSIQLQRQTERMNRLITNMLDAARAAAGHLDYDMKKMNLVPLLQEVIQDLQNTTEMHKLRLIAIPLPPVMGDGMRLIQVFTNIISNAIKYTPSSSPEPKDILIETHLAGNEIRVTITDTGIGMSAGTKARLFERFFRSDKPETHHYAGLGLGLYISKEIAQQHGGDILVQSEKGKGSVFTVVLPVNNARF